MSAQSGPFQALMQAGANLQRQHSIDFVNHIQGAPNSLTHMSTSALLNKDKPERPIVRTEREDASNKSDEVEKRSKEEVKVKKRSRKSKG